MFYKPAVFSVGHTQTIQVLRQSYAVRNAELSISQLSQILSRLVKLHHATVAVPVNRRTLSSCVFASVRVHAFTCMYVHIVLIYVP